ncbi:hypothetical protein [Corynebacterium sp. ES2775-CONJ]|uniref:hypothetical protein n=1 Tax=Corynebacterium sp. ES2775-CONJ TaxID=2974029 RepID=UPI002169DB7D|nr:hypothetical protein [Corynebacterium sp. ES2775-CONJ]MCS4490330.1 hypothetical protein [Corynebacterium sp. ES2775-CONJ]
MKFTRSTFYSITAVANACALSITTAGFAVAAEAPTTGNQITQVSSLEYAGELNETELEMAFSLIESILDSALKDEESFEQWKSGKLQFVGQPRASVGACAWGIIKALVANVFVFSKVAKLKTVINAAGGARAAAKTAINAYKVVRNEKKIEPFEGHRRSQLSCCYQ